MDKAPDAFRTISEVAGDLAVPQHVLRFWETRFAQIKPMKRGGGRRYYRPDDVDLLRGIRHLLYGEGYTIRGVQRILREHGAKFVQTVWQENAPQPERLPTDVEDDGEAANERGRGLLLGILPSLFSQSNDAATGEAEDDDERREPSFDPAAEDDGEEAESDARPDVAPARPGSAAAATAKSSPGAARPAAAAIGLSDEDRQKLHAALHDLDECRRLIDVALKDEA